MNNLSNLLKGYGFGFVKTPRANIELLRLLAKDADGNLNPIGFLSDLFIQYSLPYPDEELDMPIPNELGGLKSTETSASMGLKILGGYFKNPIGLDTAFGKADKIVFSFLDAKTDSVNLIQLDEFINDAQVNSRARTFKERLENDEIFIITDTLKSPSFSVELLDSNNAKVDLNTPEVEKIIEGNTNFQRTKDRVGHFSYVGNEDLVFGVRAVRLIYEKKKWYSKKEAGFRIEEESGYVVRGTENYSVHPLTNKKTDLFIDI
ncbi:MAG: hypothetical protein H6566_29640 [Lewinellaceae bacterium]|nr:hypothetical protein [Lewinellaceae bacterium]